jgi:hypothetical protein
MTSWQKTKKLGTKARSIKIYLHFRPDGPRGSLCICMCYVLYGYAFFCAFGILDVPCRPCAFGIFDVPCCPHPSAFGIFYAPFRPCAF